MKHIFLVALIIGLGILTRAQSELEVSTDGTEKILKGLINRDMLEKDTAFKWFTENKAAYKPAAEDVALLKARRQDLEFLVFGGTWNEETKYILPRFYSLVDAAAVSREQVTLVGVDRYNRTVKNLSQDLRVNKIPTIIILKKGQELGRVTEFGKDALWDRQLTSIINTTN